MLQLSRVIYNYFTLELTLSQQQLISEQFSKHQERFIKLVEGEHSSIVNEQPHRMGDNEEMLRKTNDFIENLQQRKELKFDIAHCRQQRVEFIETFENYNDDLSDELDMKAESLHGVQKIELSNFTEYSTSEKVRDEVFQFFKFYENLYVEPALFQKIIEFQKRMRDELQDVVDMLEKFCNDNIHWYDPKSYEEYLKHFNECELDKGNPGKKLKTIPMKLTTDFLDSISSTISEQEMLLDEIIAPLKEFIESNKELIDKFGKIPLFNRKQRLESKVMNMKLRCENISQKKGGIDSENIEDAFDLFITWFFLDSITKFNFILANIIALENGYPIVNDSLERIDI